MLSQLSIRRTLLASCKVGLASCKVLQVARGGLQESCKMELASCKMLQITRRTKGLKGDLKG